MISGEEWIKQKMRSKHKKKKKTKQKHKFVDYYTYIKSAHWKRFRYYLLKKRGFRCEKCGIVRPAWCFHIHHLTYERLGHELQSDLMVLCAGCHQDTHTDFVTEEFRSMFG